MIVWLASYPRSGNTLLRIMLNHVFAVKTNSVYNDPFDIGADQKTSEIVGHVTLEKPFDPAAARLEAEKHFVKTHNLPDEAIGDQDKIVYLVRDGREACVSQYNYFKDFTSRVFTLKEIIEGKTTYGGWASHLRAWRPRLRSNCLLLRFEDLARDPLSFVEPIASFTGIEPVSNELPSFDDLRAVNPKFFRSGKTDSWKDVFSAEDHLLFWLRSKDVMVENGYLEAMPEVFRDEPADLLRVIYERVDRVLLREYEQHRLTIAQMKKQQRAITERKDTTIRRLRGSKEAAITRLQGRVAEKEKASKELRERLRRLNQEKRDLNRELSKLTALMKLLEKLREVHPFKDLLKKRRCYQKLMAFYDSLVEQPPGQSRS